MYNTFPIFMSFKAAVILASNSDLPRLYTTSRKSKEVRGYPCLSPLPWLKKMEASPLTNIAKDTVVIQA